MTGKGVGCRPGDPVFAPHCALTPHLCTAYYQRPPLVSLMDKTQNGPALDFTNSLLFCLGTGSHPTSYSRTLPLRLTSVHLHQFSPFTGSFLSK